MISTAPRHTTRYRRDLTNRLGHRCLYTVEPGGHFACRDGHVVLRGTDYIDHTTEAGESRTATAADAAPASASGEGIQGFAHRARTSSPEALRHA